MNPILLTFSTLILTLLLWSNSRAYEISGVTLVDSIPATSNEPKLQLNGAALREMYFFIETFVGGLYLEKTSNNWQAILSSNEHKRMVFVVMLKRVGARRIGNEMQAALVGSLSEQEHLALIDDIDQMLSFFDGKLVKGERVEFNFIPNIGTKVIIKGEEKGIIKGSKYFNAVLSTWIGKNPVDREFKDQVLGLDMPSHHAKIGGI